MTSFDLSEIVDRLRSARAALGVVGLGYVGLPLALALARRGFITTGFDVDSERVAELNAARPGMSHISAESVSQVLAAGTFKATTECVQLQTMDAILLCLPTPLTAYREPDLHHITDLSRELARYLRLGQLVVLESTTYPGTTRQVVRTLLEDSGLRSERDFFLAYSPEREDPGHPAHALTEVPKVIGADGPKASLLARTLYSTITDQIVTVSSPESAEAVKLTENIFRSVNIALVNELKLVYEAMGIDIWEVIAAASTKPFGFMPFYPGPGLGGHCIPIDPFYLTWKARSYGVASRFIELAGEINAAMPRHVVDRLALALDQHCGRGLTSSSVLVVGVAYKKNIDDTRESPGIRIMGLLYRRGARRVGYHDPLVGKLPRAAVLWDVVAGSAELGEPRPSLEHSVELNSVELTKANLSQFDAAVICADHEGVDYQLLAQSVPLVVDTRNACAGVDAGRVIKA